MLILTQWWIFRRNAPDTALRSIFNAVCLPCRFAEPALYNYAV